MATPIGAWKMVWKEGFIELVTNYEWFKENYAHIWMWLDSFLLIMYTLIEK